MKLYLILFSVFLFPLIVSANQKETVDKFIAAQYKESETGIKSDTQNGELISYIQSTINSNEIVVHWMFTVANYWSHRLTLLRIKDNEFTVLDQIGSKGIIDSIRLNGNILTVEQTVYGKNDPRCCPTLDLTMKYEIKAGKIFPLNKN